MSHNLKFSTERPKKSGWYYVIWEPGNTPKEVWINYSPAGTVPGIDTDFWTWGWNESDNPEDIELDIARPDKIQFSEIIE